MKRSHGMGVNKVVVTALQPLGCLPRSTFTSSFQQCNGTENELVGFHNLLLQQAVTKLNNETKDSTFAILDLDLQGIHGCFQKPRRNSRKFAVRESVEAMLHWCIH
ncbi:GDSL esterase/lipase [Populus alba x Populus x berolinensis]|nr:GDSL esterase/lipase [Populus alba x Populus x berolinensis]